MKSILIVSIVISSLLSSCLVKVKTIKSGEVGVKQTFGEINNKVRNPGVKVYFIGSKMYRVSTKIHKVSEEQSARLKDGVLITPLVDVLYKINPSKANVLIEDYNFYRLDYYGEYKKRSLNRLPKDYSSLVKSFTNDAIAKVVSESNSYTDNNQYRALLASRIKDAIQANVSDSIFIIEKVMVNTIGINEAFKDELDIQSTLNKQISNIDLQIALKKKEVELSKLEAERVSTYNKTIDASLTPNILENNKTEALKDQGNNGSKKIIITDLNN
jgi:hypothetical protein